MRKIDTLILIKNGLKNKDLMNVTLANFFFTIAGTVFWLFAANIVNPSIYGELSYYFSLSLLLGYIATMGLHTTVSTYYPKEQNADLIGASLLITTIAALTFSIFTTIITTIYVSLLMISTAIYVVATYILLGEQKYGLYSKAVIFSRIVQIMSSVLLFFVLDWPGVLLGYVLGYLSIGLFFINKIKIANPLPVLSDKLSFIKYAFVANALYMLNYHMDRIIIGTYFESSILGYYQLAIQAFRALAFIPVSIFQYLLPQKAAGSISKNVEVAGTILAAIMTVVTIALSPFVIPIIAPEYMQTIPLFQIMVIGLIPETLIMIKLAGAFGKERPFDAVKIYFVGFLGEIVLLPILGLFYGIVGLGVATIIIRVFMLLTVYHVQYNGINNKIFKG